MSCLRCSQQVTNFMSSLHLLAGFQRANDVQFWGLRVLTQQLQQESKIVLEEKQQREICQICSSKSFQKYDETRRTQIYTQKQNDKHMNAYCVSSTIFDPIIWKIHHWRSWDFSSTRVSPSCLQCRKGTSMCSSFCKFLTKCIQKYMEKNW